MHVGGVASPNGLIIAAYVGGCRAMPCAVCNVGITTVPIWVWLHSMLDGNDSMQ